MTENTETLLEQEKLAPLKILTQHAPQTLANSLAEHAELELVAEVDLETAKASAGPETDFDTLNYKMASGSIKIAQESGADVFFYTNEQQDQLGVCARKSMKGQLQLLTGHQSALILSEILVEQFNLKEPDASEKEAVILRSLVLTDAFDVQSAYKNIKGIQTYSGLTALSEGFTEYGEDNLILVAVDEVNHVLFPEQSAQESIATGMELIAEKALALKKEGKTLIDYLIALYKEYGFYHEKSFTINREDAEGEKHIKSIMDEIRKETPDALFGKPVRVVNDFHKKTSHNLLNAKKSKTSLPKADVLQFLFTDNTKITFAPTESYDKLFYHFSVTSRISGKEVYDEAKVQASERILRLMERIGKI